ncbi:peptide deformylase [Candidatus Uhrbacteria bacterium]|nr:peptide deformylase [Candidatus Uhrbacteria bacterium]
MSRRTIITNPSPTLQEKSLPVDSAEISTTEFQVFLDDLLETMHGADGVGIAAPQVGVHKRVFVGLKGNEPHVFINPEITRASFRKVDSEEGCLSVPGIWGIVRRHRCVTVSYTDRFGNPARVRLEGLPAIVAQHETDHLEGILFIEKATRITTPPSAL